VVLVKIPTVQATITGAACPESGDWIVNTNTTVINEPDLIVNGSLYIGNQLSFYVYNSTITITGNFSTGTYKDINITVVDSTFIMASNDTFKCNSGTNYLNFDNVQIVNATGYKPSDIILRGDTSFYANNLAVEGYNTFTAVGHGTIKNSVFSKSTSKAFVQGSPTVEGLTSDNITIIDFTGQGGFEFGGSNMVATNLNIINPIHPVEASAVFGYSKNNNLIDGFYINGSASYSPHTGVVFAYGGGAGSCVNNTLKNGLLEGHMGNGLMYGGTTGANYVENVTVKGAVDGTDGSNKPLNETCNVIVSNSFFFDNTDNGLSGDNALGCGWEFVNCYVNGTNHLTIVNSTYADSFVRCTNVTFANSDLRVGGVFSQLASNAVFVQNWNWTDGTCVSLASDATGNIEAVLLTPTYIDKVVSYVLSAPSGTLTSTVYCPLGEPYSVAGASSYSFDSDTNTLTVTSSNSATVTVDYNVVSAAYVTVADWVSPLAQQYNSNSVAFEVSTVGSNDTGVALQIQLYNEGGAVYPENFTSATGTFTGLTNGIYTAAVYAVGDHGAADYEEVIFAVYVVSSTGEIFSIKGVPVGGIIKIKG
jgi:hypothetical protein